jgi:Ser/Thr protein kinase RdoA (MazF antagonist)
MDRDAVRTALPQWDATRLLHELGGGHRNGVYLVEHPEGLRVAKTTRRDEAALAWLLPVHDAARRAGLVVPTPLPSRDGALVVDGVTLEPFIAGRPLEPDELPAVGALLERFHALTRDLPQRPGFRSSADLLHAGRGGDVDLAGMPPAIAERCRAAWRHFARAPRSVVHGDVNPANLTRTADDRVALLDWDEARVDASAFDTLALDRALGRTLAPADAETLDAWEVAVSWHVEPAYARRLADRLWPGAGTEGP